MEDTLLLGIPLKDWAWLIGGIITLAGFIKGLLEFSKNNKIKRAEFLEKLIAEFNESKTFIAKRVLDDFWINIEGKASDMDTTLINNGSIAKREKEELKSLVKDLLRDHSEKSVTGNAEQRARQSFDDLLDFFIKLDYYLSLKLISKGELFYFHYYLQRCAFKADGATMSYASMYGYPCLFRLLYVLKIEPKAQKLFNDNLAFINDSQRDYYKRLRNRN